MRGKYKSSETIIVFDCDEDHFTNARPNQTSIEVNQFTNKMMAYRIEK